MRGATLCAFGVLVALSASTPAQAAAPQVSGTSVSSVTTESAVLKAEVNPQTKNTTYFFEFGTTPCEAVPDPCKIAVEGKIAVGSSPVPVSAPLGSLEEATIYHYRVIAKNSEGKDSGPDRTFATYSEPLIGLPDGRGYEQASSPNKDGGDIEGDVPLIKATASGDGISFASTFGIPGGKGAQNFPTYLAYRGTTDWSTQGLLPPPTVGERVEVIGWSPNFTEIYSSATMLGPPIKTALVVQSSKGGEPKAITPYLFKTEYAYAGESANGSTVLFETKAKLLPPAIAGVSNLYAWDSETEESSLAGMMNNGSSPPKGTFAGPYEWTKGMAPLFVSRGGATRFFYLQDEHAIAEDGSVYFTAGGTGQLYQRLHPTQPQSNVVTKEGEEECTEPALACTIHVSASHKDNGKGPGGTDLGGSQPAAFQAASANGSEAFFTSPEELTNNAKTSLEEQAPAQIEEASTGGAIEKPNFLPVHAVGIARDTSHIYWANPQAGTIGRADLNGENIEEDFIKPGPVHFEWEEEVKVGVFETFEADIESEPRYVAVDEGHVYWTNTGRRDEFGPVEGEGTIGRAKIEGGEVKPDFIRGASNPQGIAVNATHIYWANAASQDPNRNAIGRATIEGEAVNQGFFHPVDNTRPYGVALSPTRVYLGSNQELNDQSYMSSVLLEGGEEQRRFIGKAGIRGVAVDSGHVYWATQGEEAIGRADLALSAGSQENEFIELKGKPNGLMVDASHLYWALNGEAPGNPGNDLYRFERASGVPPTLEDLSADANPADKNGAEVQGVLGAADAAPRVYFAANGDLDGAGPGGGGDCHTTIPHGDVSSTQGSCDIYLWNEGQLSEVAQVRGNLAGKSTDALNWMATPWEQFGTSSYAPKSSFVSPDGLTLLFRSVEQLTPYENEGVPEFYRFRVGDPSLRCVSCRPSGEAAGQGPRAGRILFPSIGPLDNVASVSSRNFSASGEQFFFEAPEALSLADTNGEGGCPPTGTGTQLFPACTDVYEWEATGSGACKEGSPSYSPLNDGCLYLLSSGKSPFPSLFADASVSGEDVFFFTRQGLVGRDKDELQDVYDARVKGGLETQNPSAPNPCESAEACHGPSSVPPLESSPTTPGFVGPSNPKPKPKQGGKKKHKHKKKGHKGKGQHKGKRAPAREGGRG